MQKTKAPSRKRITRAIEKEIQARKRPPKEINAGKCEDFAYAVSNRLFDPNEITITGAEIDGAWTMGRWGGHVWIYASHLGDQGLHFDAECPEGISDWQDLPFYRRKKEDPSNPLGPIGKEILQDPTLITDRDTLRYIEDWSDVNCIYQHKTDGSRRNFDPDNARYTPDATYTPTMWVQGELPLQALKDCLHLRCPERKDWREWIKKENEAREKSGLDSYHSWLEGGIREEIIVDGQGPLIWDGWHRTAWAIDQGKETVPAFLGIEPGRTPALDLL